MNVPLPPLQQIATRCDETLPEDCDPQEYKYLISVLGLAALTGGRLGKEISVLLEGSGNILGLAPEFGGEEAIGLGKSVEGGLDEVTKGLGGATGAGEAILNTGELENLLGGAGSDDTGTTGGGDQANADGTALASNLGGDSVDLADLVTPVTTTNGNKGHLGEDNGTTNSSGNLLGALDTKTNVAIRVTNNNEGLEASTLTGSGLLLDRHNLHDLILKRRSKEVLNNLILLNGHREEVNLLKGLNLTLLHKATKLGAGHPLVLIIPAAASTASAAATAATATGTLVTGTFAKTTTFSHVFLNKRSRITPLTERNVRSAKL